MSGKIINGANININQQNTYVPDVSGSLQNYFQKMVFSPLEKTVSGFQLVENAAPIEFHATLQPFTPRQLLIKPEGQRAWSWYTLHAEPGIVLKVDDCVDYLGKQYRVMSKTDYTLYGYIIYELVTDWTGSGP